MSSDDSQEIRGVDSTGGADRPARVIAGRYVLGARRGTAVEAALFEAVDVETDTSVVVKIVHPDLTGDAEVRDHFDAVMQVAATLVHPNVSAVLDFGGAEFNGHEVLYAVYEQHSGGSLRDILDRGRLLTPSQALVMALEVCKGLDAMHKAGIVHGDVRPGTIVFDDRGVLKITDAGLSQVVLHATGGPAGRSNDLAQYASPETAVGAEPQARSDVYSLCLTVLEAVTGQVPFVGDSTVSTLTNRVDRLMPVSADLGALAAVLERAGRPQPADRWSAGAFGRALVQAAGRMPRPEPFQYRGNDLFSPPQPRRRVEAPQVADSLAGAPESAAVVDEPPTPSRTMPSRVMQAPTPPTPRRRTRTQAVRRPASCPPSPRVPSSIRGAPRSPHPTPPTPGSPVRRRGRRSVVSARLSLHHASTCTRTST